MEQDFLDRSCGKFPGDGTATEVLSCFPDGMLQTEIRVPLVKSHLASGLRGRFSVNGTHLYRW